ncbi:MAG TPA: MBL fold metallo-hydrolase [Dehalococcoidia bacterium]|nr:MBL fold metallo-hydrolase [Dehalococcoidia bacterium]
MDVYADGNLTVMKFGPLGQWANNAYIITDEGSKEALIVDMPAGSEEVIAAARDVRVKAILLTHTHPDHWADYDLVKNTFEAPVLAHPTETILPKDRMDGHLEHDQTISVGPFYLKALHTPGHTPGSTSFLVQRFLFSGDTLFPGGPGRTQSPEDLKQSIDSITSVLYQLPDDTDVLTGHGDNTTIGESKREYAVFASKEHPANLCGDVTWEGS